MEGKNIVIEWRSAEGKVDRLPTLGAELVSLKVDIIVTGSGTVTRPVKEATSTIPIVMALDNDPVGNGYAASLARPGGNITGLSSLSWTQLEKNWSFGRTLYQSSPAWPSSGLQRTQATHKR